MSGQSSADKWTLLFYDLPPGSPTVRPTVWRCVTQLKNLTAKQSLVKVKASYKLSDALKKPAPKKVTLAPPCQPVRCAPCS